MTNNKKIDTLETRENKMLEVETNILNYLTKLSKHLIDLPLDLDTEKCGLRSSQVLEVANLLAMTQQRQTNDFTSVTNELKLELSRKTVEVQNLTNKNKK